MKLGEPDESGRRRPVPIPGSEFTLEVDAVVPAIGQSIDLSFLPEDRKWDISKRGRLEVDLVTGATNVEGIFAGGDMVTGPATVVEAIGAGRKAAIGKRRRDRAASQSSRSCITRRSVRRARRGRSAHAVFRRHDI